VAEFFVYVVWKLTISMKTKEIDSSVVSGVQLETENTVIKGASLIAQSRDLLILNQ
jgi:hypothetical protein